METPSITLIDDLLSPEKQLKQWVARNCDKVPLRASNLHNADTTNPADWATFAEVVKAIEGKPDFGPGLVIVPPYVGIDLDTYKTTDPQIIAIHNWIHNELFPESYSEWSPRNGIHIVCQGVLRTERRRLPRLFVELKDDGYLTYTSNIIHVKPIIAYQPSLDILSEYINHYCPAPSFDPTSTVDEPETQTDDEVCIQAAKGSNGNGELFKELYQGHWQDKYESQSEADQALANIIAFYTNSRQQTARIFRASQLGKRKKALRQDYMYSPRFGLVTLAFDQKLPVPDLTDLEEKFKRLAAAARNGAQPHAHRGNDAASQPVQAVQPQAVPQPVPVPIQVMPQPEPTESAADPDEDWLKPPGLVGEVADYIYQAAPYPNRHVALFGAIGLIAGLVGRAFNTPTGTGLNQYSVLLGETGIGKEGAPSGISKLYASLLEDEVLKASLPGYRGPAEIASLPALMRHLVINPSIWSYKSEMGLWLQKLNSPNANLNDLNLRRLILDLFNKSGKKDVLDGAIYADTIKNIPIIHAPAFTLMGESTHGTFYKAIDETNIADGLLPRLTIISCPDKRPVYNPGAGDKEPSKELLTRLNRLINYAININSKNVSNIPRVDETPDAKAFQLNYQKFCQDKLWEDRSNPVNQIRNRAHMRLLRLAALLAVGRSHDCPVVLLEHYQWARKVVEHGINIVIQRFESGDVGPTSLGFKQRQLVGKIVLEYAHSKWSKKMEDKYRITREMHEGKGIPKSYIQQRVINMSPFAQEQHNAVQALTNAIEHFITVEALSEWETDAVEGYTRRRKPKVLYRIMDESKLVYRCGEGA